MYEWEDFILIQDLHNVNQMDAGGRPGGFDVPNCYLLQI